MAEVTLTTSATADAVDRVHDELDALWSREPGVGEADRARFATGVVEVLANIVEHAYRLDEGGAPDARRLTVRVHVGPEALTAVLGDDGRPFEIDLSSVTLPDVDAESGRGLALAIAALDDLRYDRTGGCNRWTLVCRRSGG